MIVKNQYLDDSLSLTHSGWYPKSHNLFLWFPYDAIICQRGGHSGPSGESEVQYMQRERHSWRALEEIPMAKAKGSFHAHSQGRWFLSLSTNWVWIKVKKINEEARKIVERTFGKAQVWKRKMRATRLLRRLTWWLPQANFKFLFFSSSLSFLSKIWINKNQPKGKEKKIQPRRQRQRLTVLRLSFFRIYFSFFEDFWKAVCFTLFHLNGEEKRQKNIQKRQLLWGFGW